MSRKDILAMLLNRVMIWICGGRLWESAKACVLLYENKEISGEEKRKRVLDLLKIEAKALGMDLAESLFNMAIEGAIQYIRRKTS